MPQRVSPAYCHGVRLPRSAMRDCAQNDREPLAPGCFSCLLGSGLAADYCDIPMDAIARFATILPSHWRLAFAGWKRTGTEEFSEEYFPAAKILGENLLRPLTTL